MIRFHCPKCESQMEVDESFAGRAARCPTCGTDLRVPKAGEKTAPPVGAQPTRQGATVVKIEGQQVEIVPPLDTMAVVSLVFVGAGVLGLFLAGLLLGSVLTYPWTVGFSLCALASMLGALIGITAYHSVRRSRGLKRGRTHALIGMGAGGALFFVALIGAIVGVARMAIRPPCEDNLKHIYTALRAYADKHGGSFPKNLETLVKEGFLDSDHWLTCPKYSVPLGLPTYVLTPDVNVTNPLFPPDLLIVSDGPPYEAHGDGYVRALLLSGEIIKVPVTNWGAYQKAQGERWNDIMNRIRNPGAAPKKPASASQPESASPPSLPSGPAGPAPAAQGQTPPKEAAK